jgi:hypothetical protein
MKFGVFDQNDRGGRRARPASDCVYDQSKLILGLPDFAKGFLPRLPCEVLLGDINMSTDQLGHVSHLSSVDDAREPRTRAL